MSYEIGTHFSFNEAPADTAEPKLYEPGTRIVFVKFLDNLASALTVRSAAA